MKSFLTITTLVVTAFIARADERTITEKARDAASTVVEKTKDIARDTKDAVGDAAHKAGKATRAAWNKTKAYMSDEVPFYHEGANATLAGLGREIAELKAQTTGMVPVYFSTRLLALDQQHKYLVKSLGQLSADQLKSHSSGGRQDFDQCVSDLEQAIDQAQDGVGILSKTAPR